MKLLITPDGIFIGDLRAAGKRNLGPRLDTNLRWHRPIALREPAGAVDHLVTTRVRVDQRCMTG